jgi:hypothetical protein
MKILKTVLLVAFSSLTLSGCDGIREKLHLLPNQDEQECLNSEKLNFKDPEVLFVANLGDRGWKLNPNSYWVRYKAKNSYGAYLQGNMLCKKVNEKWVRDTSEELLITLAITADLVEEENAKLTADNQYKLRFWRGSAEATADATFKFASDLLNESPESLSKYYAIQARKK